ncbi:MAG: porin [Gammaproteobacteria bacterium]|nr:porin [Gammaproteobacteria bacterium]
MKKSIIAMTIAAAVAAPVAANADVTAYGAVQGEITQTDNGTTATIGQREWGRGFIGLKASEELGNGMTMFGKMEIGMDTDDAQPQGNRQSYVGLKAGWGSVMIGKVPTGYKYAGGVKYDAFVATSLQARGGITMSGGAGAGQNGAQGHNGFSKDTVAFRLMDGALSVNLGTSDDPGANGAGNMGDLDIAYKIKMGGKNEIHLAHTAHSNDAADPNSSTDYSATKIAGKFGDIKAQYEMVDNNGTDQTFLFAAYSMQAAGGEVVFQGGQRDNGAATLNMTTDLTVGYIKKLSKNARWFAGFRSTDDEANADPVTTLTYGMRYDY